MIMNKSNEENVIILCVINGENKNNKLKIKNTRFKIKCSELDVQVVDDSFIESSYPSSVSCRKFICYISFSRKNTFYVDGKFCICTL